MSEINAPATLAYPGGYLNFNPAGASSDYYWLTNVAGLDQAPVRTTLEDKPQADGGIIHQTFRGPRHVTVTGLVVCQSSVTNRNAMCDSLVAALDALLNADGSWSWTPTGQTQHSLTVRCDVPISGFSNGAAGSGSSGAVVKGFAFGLVAVNPTITIA